MPLCLVKVHSLRPVRQSPNTATPVRFPGCSQLSAKRANQSRSGSGRRPLPAAIEFDSVGPTTATIR